MIIAAFAAGLSIEFWAVTSEVQALVPIQRTFPPGTILKEELKRGKQGLGGASAGWTGPRSAVLAVHMLPFFGPCLVKPQHIFLP